MFALIPHDALPEHRQCQRSSYAIAPGYRSMLAVFVFAHVDTILILYHHIISSSQLGAVIVIESRRR